MTIRMKSLKAHTFSGKRYQKDDEFDVPGESLKRVLVAIKVAEPASPVAAAPVSAAASPSPAPASPRRATSRAAVERVATAPTEQSAGDAPAADRAVDGTLAERDDDAAAATTTAPAKRAYRRRDLLAE